MIVIDASVWVSDLLPNDVNHAQSEAWFAQLPIDEVLLEPRLLLVEVAATIGRRIHDAEVARRTRVSIADYPNLVLVPMTDELIDEAAEVAAQLRLRTGDAIYVALAGLNGARLVSWDREQLARAAPVVQASSPADDLFGDE